MLAIAISRAVVCSTLISAVICSPLALAAVRIVDTQTLRPLQGADRERASWRVASEVAALRNAPATESERDKDRLYRLPLSAALVEVGKMPSARHQWRSILRRIPASDARRIAILNSAIPVTARDFAMACRDFDTLVAAQSQTLGERRCTLLREAMLAERRHDRATARDRWFEVVASPNERNERTIGFARYAAIDGLVTTMP